MDTSVTIPTIMVMPIMAVMLSSMPVHQRPANTAARAINGEIRMAMAAANSS